MNVKQLEALREKAVAFTRCELHRDDARRFNDELLSDPALFEAAVGVFPELKVNVFAKSGEMAPGVSVARAVELYWRGHASEGCQVRITGLLDENVEWAQVSEDWCREKQPLDHADVVTRTEFFRTDSTAPAVRLVCAASWRKLAEICVKRGEADYAAGLVEMADRFEAA